jgi:Tfp pilus assembly protein PilW
MTLVELMVATGVGSIVLVAVMSLSLLSARSFAALTNYVDLDIKSRTALDTMAADIRQAEALTSASLTNLTFKIVDISSGATNALNYNYDSARTTLTRTLAGQSTVLLTNCTFLQFSIFMRNPVDGTYDQYPVDDMTRPDLCKLVQLTWICSRNVLGRFANTESVQSAKIVIRKS